MEEKEVLSKEKMILLILIPVLGILCVSLSGILYSLSFSEIIRNIIIIGILLIASVFTVELDIISGRMLCVNVESLLPMFIIFVCFLPIVCAYRLIPQAGWVFLPVFAALTLFSGVSSAFVLSVSLLTIPILLSGIDTSGYLFVQYGVPGLVACLLFSTIDEELKVGKPILLSLLFQFLTLSVFGVLTSEQKFEFGMLLLPALNIVISLALILVALRIFSFSFINRSKDRYLDIVDPDFELMVRFKDYSKSDYDHSIYTAILCSKLSEKLGLDEPLLRALGYYHRIGILKGANNYENAFGIMKEYGIPAQVVSILKEYLDPGTPIKSKETVVLMFADTVITSVHYLFSKDPATTINYSKLINAIFEKKTAGGSIADSKISFEELNILKEALTEEKMFYDLMKK